MLHIHYTRHALHVLGERKLSKELIDSVILSPEWKESVSGDVWCGFRRTGRKVLRVVVKGGRDSLTVITAYYDRRKV